MDNTFVVNIREERKALKAQGESVDQRKKERMALKH